MNLKYRIFEFKILGKSVFKNRIIKLEGGEKESETLRTYVKEKYDVDIGLYSYGSCFQDYFNLGGTVKIGRYCSFATNVHYFGANHPINSASTSPYFYNASFGFDVIDVPRSTLTVGHDVWCGSGSIITSGCKNIGNGAVIAAGSIVTHDVPAYTIVKGNPAQFYKMRFEQDTIEKLEESRWYDMKPDELMRYYKYISSPQIFANKIIESKNYGN